MWRWLTVVGVAALLLASCSSSDGPEPVAQPEAATSEPVAQTVDAVLAGLTTCDSLWQSGDPVVTPSPFSQFTRINGEIAKLSKQFGDELIVGWGSGQSVYGRLTVTVSRRDPVVLGAIREIDDRYGDQDDICIEVPPVGYYDEPFEMMPWSVARFSQPVAENWQSLSLSVGRECSGGLRRFIRPPEVTYTATEVQIVMKLDHIPWGLALQSSCEAPALVLVPLPEDPRSRPLVDATASTNAAADPADPVTEPTPAPVPPGALELADPSTTIFLQQILVAAGFEHIVGEEPRSPAWSAIATWEGERYDVTLFEHESRSQPPLSGEDVVCHTFTLRLDDAMPEAARDALSRAAACDGPTKALDLTVSYEACVHEAGMPSVQAQVFVGSTGVPYLIKTAPEVPGEVHGPCWEAIGGEPTELSSYGSVSPTPTPG